MDESGRIARRRRELGLRTRLEADSPRWALALSAGGVRSAAYCLGVLQSLAHAKMTADSHAEEGEVSSTRPDGLAAADGDVPVFHLFKGPISSDPSDGCVLNEFDYVSTTGGGGFTGAFFCSLFLPGRLMPKTSEHDAAREAIALLSGQDTDPSTRGVLAWLRLCGSNVTVGGAGGVAFAVAQYVRNWAALQIIIGSAIALLFSLFMLIHHLSIGFYAEIGHQEMDVIHDARQKFHEGGIGIFWSPLLLFWYVFIPPVCVTFAGYFYIGIERRNFLFVYLLCASVAFSLGISFLFEEKFNYSFIAALCITGGTALVGAIFGVLSGLGKLSTGAYVVRMTWIAAWALGVAVTVAFLGVVDTTARTLYLAATIQGSSLSLLNLAALLIVFVVAAGFGGIGALGTLFGMASSILKIDSHVARIPSNILPWGAAVIIIFLNTVVFDVLVLAIRWDGKEPLDWLVFGNIWTAPTLAYYSLFFGIVTIIAGRWPRVLDLTAPHILYSAHVARAFLGASNGNRGQHQLDPSTPGELIQGDSIPLRDYFATSHLAPLHLINVHVANTIDHSSGAIRRDWRGHSMCVGPGREHRFAKEDARYLHDNTAITIDGRPAAGRPALDVGEWIATSGTSTPTNYGRPTSLATALFLGLTNVRFGRWWCRTDAGADASGPTPEFRQHLGDNATQSGLLRRLLPNHVLLASELTARFDGQGKGWRYLTDGGDFDKLAIYETLRTDRNVGLIVACDCTSDPTFAFQAYGELVTLARENLGLVLEIDDRQRTGPFAVFGSLADFAAPKSPSNMTESDKEAIALLINVYDVGSASFLPPARANRSVTHPSGPPRCRIILLKPRVTTTMADDLRIQAIRNAGFPHDLKNERFLSDGEWDLYRLLGASTAALAIPALKAIAGEQD